MPLRVSSDLPCGGVGVSKDNIFKGSYNPELEFLERFESNFKPSESINIFWNKFLTVK